MKNTARTLARILVLVLALAVSGCALAETVYVSISDDGGNVCLAYQPIEMRDTDGDGQLTVSDALYLAHEAAYVGGAAEGYQAAESEYGISLNKLWGVENGGSYGYCVNNVSALSLADPVADGDLVYAYCYQDLAAWSDAYSYFDRYSVESSDGKVELCLTAVGFDADWNIVENPVADAIITIDGADSEFVTDAEGKVTVELTASCVLSARSESMTLVPPVCRVEIG